MRYRRVKRDANHGTFVAALERAGCVVQDLAMVGGGCQDLLVSWRNKNFVIEIKDPDRDKGGKNSAQGVTQRKQQAWREKWRGPCGEFEYPDVAISWMLSQT